MCCWSNDVISLCPHVRGRYLTPPSMFHLQRLIPPLNQHSALIFVLGALLIKNTVHMSTTTLSATWGLELWICSYFLHFFGRTCAISVCINYNSTPRESQTRIDRLPRKVSKHRSAVSVIQINFAYKMSQHCCCRDLFQGLEPQCFVGRQRGQNSELYGCVRLASLGQLCPATFE